MSVYRVLDTTMAKLYGRISYSFYLLHGFTMYVICNAFLPRLPSASLQEHPVMWSLILTVVSVACATPLSWFFFQHVEKPGIDWGRRLFARS